jgi:hypothetical protein
MGWYDYTPGDQPITVYGYHAPAGTNPFNTCFSLQHRGYVAFPGTGTYIFNIDGEVDDFLYIWLGDQALSGKFYPRDSQLRKLYATDTNSQMTFSIIITESTQYLPIRVYYSNCGGAGAFHFSIIPPLGSPQPAFVDCSGIQTTPPWLPWEQEAVTSG